MLGLLSHRLASRRKDCNAKTTPSAIQRITTSFQKRYCSRNDYKAQRVCAVDLTVACPGGHLRCPDPSPLCPAGPIQAAVRHVVRPNLAPSRNVAPTNDAIVMGRHVATGEHLLDRLCPGLIPFPTATISRLRPSTALRRERPGEAPLRILRALDQEKWPVAWAQRHQARLAKRPRPLGRRYSPAGMSGHCLSAFR